MKRITIALVSLCLLTVLGIGAWRIVPAGLTQRTEHQACQAIVEQMRRQLASAGAYAVFAPCQDMHVNPTDGGGWFVYGTFELDEAWWFIGTAWQAADGWETEIMLYESYAP